MSVGFCNSGCVNDESNANNECNANNEGGVNDEDVANKEVIANNESGSAQDKLCGFGLDSPVVFVGFMGAGKSSTGRRLAKTCGVSCIDTDKYIESRVNMSVGDFFMFHSEEEFRELEAEVLEELLSGEPCFITCGGGIVVGDKSREILKNSKATVIFLKISADGAKKRIRNYNNRPLFGDIENARRINSQRQPWYEEVADYTIDVENKMPSDVAYEVRKTLLRRGILCPKRK
jgi:shikimate kinase